ncbi:MAG: hypothetical protein VXU42_04065, partial [Verrucomicrobiota bacterium]|nr:hypothetical protein [Verrucomicrobiota bacterium]
IQDEPIADKPLIAKDKTQKLLIKDITQEFEKKTTKEFKATAKNKVANDFLIASIVRHLLT